MSELPSQSAPLNPDISKSNYVELISVDIDTQLSVCNNESRSVESSFPLLLNPNNYNACDPYKDPKIKSFDQVVTHVQDIQGNLVPQNPRSVKLLSESTDVSAAALLGDYGGQVDVLANVGIDISAFSASSTFPCQPFTNISNTKCDSKSPTGKIDIHFIDAGGYVDGARSANAMKQLGEALRGGNYDYRIAATTLRGTPQRALTEVTTKILFTYTVETIKGFGDAGCGYDYLTVPAICKALSERCRANAVTNAGIKYNIAFRLNINRHNPTCLAPLAISSIIRSNGFKTDFVIDGSETQTYLTYNLFEGIVKYNFPPYFDYYVMNYAGVNSSNSPVVAFTNSKFDPLMIKPTNELLRFRSSATKILCVYAEDFISDLVYNDNGKLTYSTNSGTTMLAQAIACGYKLLFIVNNSFGNPALSYFDLESAFGSDNFKVVSIDDANAINGTYSDNIRYAINKLAGITTLDGTDVIPFGEVQQVWQTNSVINSNISSQAVTYFNLNDTTADIDTFDREPKVYDNLVGHTAYDVAFDRLWHINKVNDLYYRLDLIDLSTNISYQHMDLPFLHDDPAQLDTNVPTAVCYDPGMRFLFIGTDSGHLYSINTENKTFSEIQVSGITFIDRTRRTHPSITSICIGYIPSSNYSYKNPVTNVITNYRSLKGLRSIFVGMNVQNPNQSTRKSGLIRAYDYDALVFNRTGDLEVIKPISNNDVYLFETISPRSFNFFYTPTFNYTYALAPAAQSTGFLPGLAFVYQEWGNGSQTVSTQARMMVLNPQVFSNVFSVIKPDYTYLAKFPIPTSYWIMDCDYAALDPLGEYMVTARIEDGLPQKSISYYYARIPETGLSGNTVQWYPSKFIKVNQYRIADVPYSIFIRNSLECASNLRIVEKTVFSPTNLNGWNYRGSAVNLADAFKAGELVLKNSEYIYKTFENSAGLYFLSVTTSDYRTADDKAGVNLTGFINISTPIGNVLHYIPNKIGKVSALPDVATVEQIQRDYTPTTVTIAGTATYLLNLPDNFTISLRNSLASGFFGSTNPLVGAFNPYGAGIIGVKLCKLVDTATPNNGLQDFKLSMKFNGIPRQEVNFFGSFLKVTFRDLKDFFKKQTVAYVPMTDGRTTGGINKSLVPSCTVSETCNFWKQNGNAGLPSQKVLNQVNYSSSEMLQIKNMDIAQTDRYSNCLWCIPAGNSRINVVTGLPIQSTSPDVYTLFFGDIANGMIVESVEYFFLANRINDKSSTAPSCAKVESYCGPDPVSELEINMVYVNCRGDVKNVTQFIKISDFYQQDANIALIQPSNRWDYIRTAVGGLSGGPPLGNAYKGSEARWMSYKFILDDVIGTGIDQCTIPNPKAIIYEGTTVTTQSPDGLRVPVVEVTCQAKTASKCAPVFNIEDLTSNLVTNEVQVVDVPIAGGGTFDLTFAKNGQKETATMPYNVTADAMKIALEALTIIGTGNTFITQEDRLYTVEFVDKLGAMALPIMVPHSRNLTGTYFAYTGRIDVGTRNERQTIAKAVLGSYRSFVLSFGGEQTAAIPYNASLNTVRAALEALNGIGKGNTIVTGVNVSNPDNTYSGPWHIDFVGTLANTNVPRLSVSNADYNVFVDWIGGIGINEKQYFRYKANAGSYTLKLFGQAGESATTEPIKYNAQTNEVKAKILAACPFFTDADIKLEFFKNGNEYSWSIEYVGAYASTPFQILQISSVDLVGDQVTVKRIQQGGGKPKTYRWTYTDTLGGYYILKFQLVNGSTYFTDHIQFNATPSDIEDLLNRTTLFDVGDVKVVQTDPGVLGSYQYTLTIKKNVPSLTLTAIYLDTLLCDPIIFDLVNDPPYEYQPIRCPDQEPLIHGVDGLACIPYPPEPYPDPPAPCCTVESIPIDLNRSEFMRVERDLFDPYMVINGKQATVGSLMAARNYKKSQYKAFYLDYSNTCVTLIEAKYTDVLKTRSTIVIMTQKVLDTIPKIRIIERIKNKAVKKEYCGALPSQIGKFNNNYPDIMPGKNYNIV